MSADHQPIDPQLPLALLLAVRRQDTPGDLLPDENPERSFPGRLGLSDVVERQIREFRRLARRHRRVEVDQVEALLRLIARRPDAGTIFDVAGRTLADRIAGGLRGQLRGLVRHLPESLRYRAAARVLRGARGDVLIARDASVRFDPFELRAVDVLTARIDPSGSACRLYEALMAGLVQLHGGDARSTVHVECETRGDEACVWRIEPPAQ